MAFYSVNRRFVAGLALTGFMLAAAGCQSSDNGILNLGIGKKPDPTAPIPPQDPKILASQLRAYCPKVTLRDGTAFFNTYAKGSTAKPKKKKGNAAADAEAQAAAAAAQTGPSGQPVDPDHDPAKIIYQASISDVTRDCTHANGQLSMKIAVAGKVVPGPLFAPGTVTMPIRIAVQHGNDVLYSQLHQYQVQVTDPTAATQFVFTDANVVVPEPSATDYQAYAGYDENTPAPAADKAKGKRKKRAPTTN
ncbi:hypothetical protein EN828_04325 [Mesorhizobium sp. M2D.F.Ca.ET.185.01.1.1]|uniref:hypothetical protein n=1 Tax=unclassified Mesorhizobium TaxID=325217 RepID=UPI000FCB3519|nr:MULTISPECIES: hypothetical protein [unclassified Mesorhizobium]TGP56881.1 hypothetical protein EN873_01835 [bacterium M00.F.Ca.ET.230.01.1.1]TGP75555.1 hypothetical protein EN870_25175 [bacterium M00.F.Ca.ET.227.01.1.1]TGP90433.1 hypothetical protein EN865_24580 [bacterium M00.F.Ca.ET.222.01.1.1]TGP96577.1 hypothetical protein EN864_08840 [bacterium M00.F.Ca.ET.221.01.1.1]TGT68960.1 hypothetical protein EN802_25025 [bacterium M00.F.Ca.ET.159.01.1.1]TGT80822.1 hypothetical protein EN800_243